jgi:hypothetical protein
MTVTVAVEYDGTAVTRLDVLRQVQGRLDAITHPNGGAVQIVAVKVAS